MNAVTAFLTTAPHSLHPALSRDTNSNNTLGARTFSLSLTCTLKKYFFAVSVAVFTGAHLSHITNAQEGTNEHVRKREVGAGGAREGRIKRWF